MKSHTGATQAFLILISVSYDLEVSLSRFSYFFF